MEQRRFASIISGIGRKMMNIWEFARESDGKYRLVGDKIESKILWDCEHQKKTMDVTFKNYLRNIFWLKDYDCLDDKKDVHILEMIESAENRWMLLIERTDILRMKREEFRNVCEKLLSQLEA